MKYLILPCLGISILTLTGCASTIQKGGMVRAQDALGERRFAACLAQTSRSETFGSFSTEMDARIMFFKAVCLGGIGEDAASNGVLEKLVKLYPETGWATVATRILNGPNQ